MILYHKDTVNYDKNVDPGINALKYMKLKLVIYLLFIFWISLHVLSPLFFIKYFFQYSICFK